MAGAGVTTPLLDVPFADDFVLLIRGPTARKLLEDIQEAISVAAMVFAAWGAELCGAVIAFYCTYAGVLMYRMRPISETRQVSPFSTGTI